MMLGGVSEIGEVDRPKLELRMAVAGPLVRFVFPLFADMMRYYQAEDTGLFRAVSSTSGITRE